MSYWDGREERAKRAKTRTEKMESEHTDEIRAVSENTVIYDEYSCGERYYIPGSEGHHPNIVVEPLDSVSAIYKYQKNPNLAVLNFASYKNPGGKFIEGSKAQEECLCHESFLYNVLRTKQDYYDWNRKHLNQSLYENRALYSPDVKFFHGTEFACDVITCAAPNYYAAHKYRNVSFDENSHALYSRIRFVLDVAAANGVKTIILGAYGCGVFGQDPEYTAKVFNALLPDYPFETVVFAVPDKNSANYRGFSKVFSR